MKTAMIAGLVILIVLAASVGFALKPGKTSNEVAPESASTAPREVINSVPGGLDITGTPQATELTLEAAPPAGPGFYSEQEYTMFKAEYYCELARTTRLNCEAIDRGQAGNEQCLKLNQYYTYSRHCGSEP